MLSKYLPPLLALMLFSHIASAGHERYELPWKIDSERIIYRSCGCADSCWIAQLSKRESKKLKAVIRCDCSVLFVRYPTNSPERVLAASCDTINNQEDKATAISREFESLLKTNSP